ncbi:MAG: DUF4445 domain-containing protein [Deltaproteobacteria bacterium]|nr:DUF4445 domain-containing protein [Deltaproteobacteria bacterium]
MAHPQVTFHPNNVTVSGQDGERLMDLALKAGIDITNLCGGQGVCGSCRVRIIRGKVRTTGKQIGFMDKRSLEAGYVLACQTFLTKDNVEVWIPPESRMDGEQILTDYDASFIRDGSPRSALEPLGKKVQAERFLCYEAPCTLEEGAEAHPPEGLRPICTKVYLELPPPTLDDNLSDLDRIYRELHKVMHELTPRAHFSCLWGLARLLRENDWRITTSVYMRDFGLPLIRAIEPGDTSKRNFGVAVDVGTTTIAAQLVDLTTGRPVGTEASHNRQSQYGEDVISRMIFACTRGGQSPLNMAVISTINTLMNRLAQGAGIRTEEITCIVAAGNTTMTHLLLDLEPCHIRVAPYIPTANRVPLYHTVELGLKAHPRATLHCLPCVSSYVGGDIVAGVLACGMAERSELSALIDVGTNGEIAVGNSDWLVCCSASAGPAFEGGGIQCGMRATRGAIEKAEIRGERVRIRTVGRAKPRGICGSGLIDLVAELVAEDIIDQSGRFIRMDHPRVQVRDDTAAFVAAEASETESGEPVILTEDDIGNLIKSKGAVMAAMKVLLDSLGMSFNDLDKVYVAGGFGAHLDIEKAIFVGLLPDIPQERIQFIGNSSLAGARLALTSTDAFGRAEEISKKMTYFELSVRPEFMNEFVAALFLPHTQMELFPSVVKAIARRRKHA